MSREKGQQLKMEARVRARQALRRAHLKRQGNRCVLCECRLDFERSVLFHKKPWNKEAEDTLENTAATCKGCCQSNPNPR